MTQTPRAFVTTRTGLDVLDMAYLERSSGLGYETAMPGGMTLASCKIPWNIAVPKPRLNGCTFIVRDGIDPVWWGRIYDVTDIVSQGDRMLQLSARGPWELAARQPFTQDYTSAYTWSSEDILRAALFGNCEDVAIYDDNWSLPGITMSPIAWSGSTVQTAIGDTLRFGDTSTSPWSLVILPPVTRYGPSGVYAFSTQCSATPPGDFTVDGHAGAGQVDLDTALYHRGGSSYYLYANTVAGTAYAYKTLAQSTAEVWWEGWFYLYTASSTAGEHDFLAVHDGAGTLIVRVSCSTTNNLYAYNNHTATAYNTTQPIGRGCWHHLALRVVRHAATGIVEVWLDNERIINEINRDTGDSNIKYLYAGMIRTAVGNRRMNIDTLLAHTSRVPLEDCVLATETLPEARIVKLDTSSYDMIVSLASIGGDYQLNQTLQDAANQVETNYGGAAATVLTKDATSVGRYGQMHTQLSATKSTTEATVGYLQARWLAQFATPRQALQPFTLTTPPQTPGGAPFPLCRIRSGLRFRIRELPELGNMYIGQTSYKRAEMGQAEECAITPYGAFASIDAQIAIRTQRAWT